MPDNDPCLPEDDPYFRRVRGICEGCAQMIAPGVGCSLQNYVIQPARFREEHIRKDGGAEYFDPVFQRYLFGDDFAVHLEEVMDHCGYCLSCRVKEGQYHHPGCTVERCPCCGGQAAVECRCKKRWE